MHLEPHEVDDEGYRYFNAPVASILGSPKRTAARNRTPLSFEDRIQRVYRLRKGKMEKDQGKALTKKQDNEVMAYARATVTAKDAGSTAPPLGEEEDLEGEEDIELEDEEGRGTRDRRK